VDGVTDLITVTTNPPDLERRLRNYPDKLAEEMEKTMNQAIHHVVGSVPEYPTQLPTKYVRTGTLGRTIGIGSQPDIFEVRRIGQQEHEGRVGSRLGYAMHVIGTLTQTAVMRAKNWWTMRTVAEKSKPGIERLFQKMAGRIAKWIAGQAV
jgi:hypothetical protein